MLADLVQSRSSLPEGVLQVILGGKPIVDKLCTHSGIEAISFVGGSAAGKHIYETGTQHGKRVQANLGAKNHAVILPDADREATSRQWWELPLGLQDNAAWL